MPAKDIYHDCVKNALIHFGELLIKNNRVRLLVFDSEAEDIIKWTL